ncbi:hypothetical protein IPM62_01665 [Candidatus Woesebacteria bacterium]|nr:MAG: hypothetical protein IPM62_01665 [Candidatus Woesebacteria bacterium]
MKKTAHIIYKLTKGAWGLVFFVVGVVIVALTAYFLGNSYLTNVMGSDSFYHLSNIYWFGEYFPHIPKWYPLQNGGVVPVWGYPYLPYAIVILIERISSLSYVGAYELLGFLSIPISAIGLYLFVWLRIKSQPAALISSVLYVLAPISWVFLVDWGFYTEAISFMFFFPTLLFFDYYISSYGGNRKWLHRLALVGTVKFLALTFLTHPTSFFVLVSVMASLAFVKHKAPITKIYLKLFVSIKTTLFIVLPTLMLLGFILIDFYSYSSNTPFGGLSNYRQEEFLATYPTPVDSLLGLGQIPVTDFRIGHRNIVVPPVVWGPALVGIFIALFYSNAIVVLGILAFLPVVFFRFPLLAWYVIKYVPFSGFVFHHRAILIYIRMLTPVVAGFGLWGIFYLVFDKSTFWIQGKKKRLLISQVVAGMSGVLSLVLAVYLIIALANKPVSLWKNSHVRYGPNIIDARDPFAKNTTVDYCEMLQPGDPGRQKACDLKYVTQNLDVNKMLEACLQNSDTESNNFCTLLEEGKINEADVENFVQECKAGKHAKLCEHSYFLTSSEQFSKIYDFRTWPRIAINNNLPNPLSRFSNFIKENDNTNLRIDVSPYLGGVVQTMNLESKISMINLYAITLSKLGPYWGYEQQVFFSENVGNTGNVNNLADWFGIKYLFLEDKLDFIPKYENDSDRWEKVDDAGVWKNKRPLELYSWTVEKPRILVIGSAEKRAYEPVFRTAVDGGFDYEDGWLILGKENIDDYSEKELAKFDTVVLYGYKYKNKNKAHALLDTFVKEGGNVFISGGWQYEDADWNSENLPDFFPVHGLMWESHIDKTSKLKIVDKEIGGDLSDEIFSPLVWSNESWGVSVPSDIPGWAKVVLEADNKPLVVAGEYGEGKVIWTGINLLGHINTYKNYEEGQFFGNLLKWFGEGDITEEISQTKNITLVRTDPDEVNFKFTASTDKESTLYWRETEYEKWQANLIRANGKREKINIYRAGPGFMLMVLPEIKEGDEIILKFSTGLTTIVGMLLSSCAVLILLIYLCVGEKLKPIIDTKLTQVKPGIGHKITNRKVFTNKVNEDFDY